SYAPAAAIEGGQRHEHEAREKHGLIAKRHRGAKTGRLEDIAKGESMEHEPAVRDPWQTERGAARREAPHQGKRVDFAADRPEAGDRAGPDRVLEWKRRRCDGPGGGHPCL